MNQEKEMSLTLSFRQEDDGTWSIQSSLDDQADASGFVPITTLPIDLLKTITRTPGEPPLPPELKKALEDQLTVINKKLTEEADAAVKAAVSLGDGQYLIDGVVNQYFPTVNVGPKDMPDNVMISFEYAKDPILGWLGRQTGTDVDGDLFDYFPLDEMPLSALKSMTLLTPSEPLPPELATAIERLITVKELAAIRKAE